jgi:hypoxanthine-guanine phosphoribosyltransferase
LVNVEDKAKETSYSQKRILQVRVRKVSVAFMFDLVVALPPQWRFAALPVSPWFQKKAIARHDNPHSWQERILGKDLLAVLFYIFRLALPVEFSS